MSETIIMGLLSKLKGLWISDKKLEIEGYILKTDITNNQTFLLVKEGERLWKSKWFNNNEYTFTSPKEPMSTIFK
jgi:hypothetical protein